jgi:hypothetical protein
MECNKYEKDGILKKTFAGKSVQPTRPSNNTPCSNNMMHENNSAYMQLSAKITKLEKSNRKLKHASKRHKRNRKSDCKDSNFPEGMSMVALQNS